MSYNRRYLNNSHGKPKTIVKHLLQGWNNRTVCPKSYGLVVRVVARETRGPGFRACYSSEWGLWMTQVWIPQRGVFSYNCFLFHPKLSRKQYYYSFLGKNGLLKWTSFLSWTSTGTQCWLTPISSVEFYKTEHRSLVCSKWLCGQ